MKLRERHCSGTLNDKLFIFDGAAALYTGIRSATDNIVEDLFNEVVEYLTQFFTSCGKGAELDYKITSDYEQSAKQTNLGVPKKETLLLKISVPIYKSKEVHGSHTLVN
jgi:hypothetical protein